MDKQSLPSIEKIAAYLDGNLSQEEIQQLSNLAVTSEEFRHLLDANASVEETLANYHESDLLLPEEIANMDFELPNIGNIDVSNFIADSFTENQSLYKQENIHDVDKILDDVFDDKDFDTKDLDDLDIDVDLDLDTDIF